MTTERITSATGGQKDRKAEELANLEPLALLELSRVAGHGARKYDQWNYLKGYRWTLSANALLRHLMAFLSGEDHDPESGLLHTAHVAWHALALTSFQIHQLGEDDRWNHHLGES